MHRLFVPDCHGDSENETSEHWRNPELYQRGEKHIFVVVGRNLKITTLVPFGSVSELTAELMANSGGLAEATVRFSPTPASYGPSILQYFNTLHY